MLPKAERADITLLLEGTYPYVRGGVSSWVHHLIKGFPEYTFAAVFLGSKPEAYGDIAYELPKNLVHLEVHYLHAGSGREPLRRESGDAEVFADVRAMHEGFLAPGGCPHAKLASTVGHLMEGRLKQEHFLDSREAWNLITSLYRERSTDPSFIDYFWTVRSMHEPVWTLARVAREAIPSRCYHSVSTGYAGFLGSLLALHGKRPLILSEHGLYTKERKIDLFHSAWIPDSDHGLSAGPAAGSGVVPAGSGAAPAGIGVIPGGNYIRQLWIRFFEALGRTAYASADPIVSLYDGIRVQQIADGAAPDRTQCIPNGIKVERFALLRAKRAPEAKPVFTLIGRVVPIKDVKTFIRAIRAVKNVIPDAQGWVVGPGDEDPRYFEECRALATALGLDDCLQFPGFMNVDEILPITRVLVLSSISEALPLTLLEGFAAGVPAVTTDVGSCRQLIEGDPSNPEDTSLGRSGRVVDIGNPSALAQAIALLHNDAEEWRKASIAGISRVERFYTEAGMLERYRSIYAKSLVAKAVG